MAYSKEGKLKRISGEYEMLELAERPPVPDSICVSSFCPASCVSFRQKTVGSCAFQLETELPFASKAEYLRGILIFGRLPSRLSLSIWKVLST